MRQILQRFLIERLVPCCKILSRFPTFWKLRSIFGSRIIPIVGKKKLIHISLPSIYFKCDTGGQAYKKRGSLIGGVRTDIPWVRPHDSDAAANIKVLLSDFVGDINNVSDEDIDNNMLSENIVCIGGQSNWIFEQFILKGDYISPLKYRINQSEKKDGFYTNGKSYESSDAKYLYGLFAVIKNPKAEDKRIVFVSGLNADATLEMSRTLKDNLDKIHKKVKLIKNRQVGFYGILKFKRTEDPKVPLIYEDIYTGNFLDKDS